MSGRPCFVLLFFCCRCYTCASLVSKVGAFGGDGGVSAILFSNGTCPPPVTSVYHCLKCKPCGGQSTIVCPPYWDNHGREKNDVQCNIDDDADCVEGYLASGFMCVNGPMVWLRDLFMNIVAVAMILLIFFGYALRRLVMNCRRRRRAHLQKPEAWIRAGPRVHSQNELYPSDLWRGHFAVADGARFEVSQHELRFNASGTVEGSGQDAGGSFKVSGIYRAATQRVAFRKEYELGSKARGRTVPEDMQRRVVEFRGEPAGAMVGSGIKGRWLMAGTERGGNFHFWPATASLDDGLDAEAPADLTAPELFGVEDGSCVVCFDGAIDTKLTPCGHIAICRLCAEQLPLPVRCPLCRVAVSAVLCRSSVRTVEALSVEEASPQGAMFQF